MPALASTAILRNVRAPVLLLFAFLLLTGCGVNAIPTLEERANAAWSEVQNQYQRRTDLVPNLVETVKRFAAQEREVLTQVTERSEEHTSELQPLMRNSYAVFCL